jgi:hypothetical protein
MPLDHACNDERQTGETEEEAGEGWYYTEEAGSIDDDELLGCL